MEGSPTWLPFVVAGQGDEGQMPENRAYWTRVVGVATSGTKDDRESCVEKLATRPGVVVVSGECRGLDLELCLAATLVVASPDARFRGEGASPPRCPGTLHRLRQRLGAGGSLAFWLDPRGWSARRAHSRGLVDALSEDAARFARERWGQLWESQEAATEKLLLLTRSRSALSESGAIALERALFALSFADERARKGARGFFE